MLTVVASVVVSWLPVVPVAPIVDDKAVKELSDLGRKIHEAESYTYTWVREGRAEPAGEAKPGDEDGDKPEQKEPTQWRAEVKRKLPTHLLHGDLEFYKGDDALVARTKDSKWDYYGTHGKHAGETAPVAGAGGSKPGSGGADGHKPSGAGGGHKDPGGAGGTGPSGAGGGDGADPRLKSAGRDGTAHKSGTERMVMQIESMPVPHRMFGDFAKKVADVKREEKDGKVVYVAELTPEGARDLVGGAHLPRPPGDRGPATGTAEAEFSGIMRISAAGDSITRIEIDVRVKGAANGHNVRSVVEISNVDKTEVVPPAEVMALLAPKK